MAHIRTLVSAAVTLLCFTQILEVRTANRLTTANPSTDNQLQAALTSAQQAVSEALGLDSLPPAETVASSLHNHTLNFARTVGQFVGQLQNEASSHEGAISSVLQSVAAKWNETATTLQDQNPEVTRTAQELRTSFSSGIQSFLEEAQKLVNAIAPDTQAAGGNLQEITRTALDRVQETANEFRNSVQTATQNQPAN